MSCYENNTCQFFYYISFIILLQLSHFSPLYSLLPCTPPATTIPTPLSSCPWVVHISSLASPFPILFLTSPCLFHIFNVSFLFPVPFPSFTPHLLPVDNPPCDLYFCESVVILVVCLIYFCFFFFRFSCWWLWVCCHFTVHSFDLVLFPE